MSFTSDTPAGAAAAARATKKLTRQVAAALTGKKRGDDPEVRRLSYDVDDPRARVWRPIGDGTVAGGRGWVEDLIQVAQEFAVWSRNRFGGRGQLTPYDVDVLRAFCLGSKLDYKTGRLEPALAWIERATGFARQTIVDALKRLRRHGFMDWVRRSRKTDRTGEAGPQREQVTNAYFFDLARMSRRVIQRFRDLREKRRRRAANQAPAAPAGNRGRPADPKLAEALTSLGQKVAERESLKPPLCPRKNQRISGRASRGAI